MIWKSISIFLSLYFIFRNPRITVLQLAFDRLAVRVEVLLEAKDNFDEVFEGITFSNIPNLVPLTENYVADSEEATVKWKEIT